MNSHVETGDGTRAAACYYSRNGPGRIHGTQFPTLWDCTSIIRQNITYLVDSFVSILTDQYISNKYKCNRNSSESNKCIAITNWCQHFRDISIRDGPEGNYYVKFVKVHELAFVAFVAKLTIQSLFWSSAVHISIAAEFVVSLAMFGWFTQPPVCLNASKTQNFRFLKPNLAACAASGK